MVSAMVMRGGNSLFLILTPSHAHSRIQQGRSHIRRNPRRHALVRANIRPTAIQTSTGLHDGRTTPVMVFDSPSLRETPPTNQTAERPKRGIIRLEILLSAERKTTVMPPNPARPVLPVLRHIGYLPLVVSNTASRVLGEIHQDTFRMRGNPLTVHSDFATNVD